ncbi:MAG: Lsm family RNA-binding protein [Candidatus Bathyarchaeota archaeon]|nr:MAG: Lsm family RNA-binding protein [Candidatus Bathyarchaeota archaeon]
MASRRYFEELGQLMGKSVRVKDVKGNTFDGVLLGYDSNTLSICLGDVTGEQGTKVHRIFVYGSTIAELSASERPFNLEGLAERLERVFPNMVRTYHDAGVIVVMDKIRVNETGIVEGSGPAADRVRDIHQRFISETV